AGAGERERPRERAAERGATGGIGVQLQRGEGQLQVGGRGVPGRAVGLEVEGRGRAGGRDRPGAEVPELDVAEVAAAGGRVGLAGGGPGPCEHEQGGEHEGERRAGPRGPAGPGAARRGRWVHRKSPGPEEEPVEPESGATRSSGPVRRPALERRTCGECTGALPGRTVRSA